MKKKTTKSARNPRSLANLRPPWEKGTSGNPTGRPKDDAGEIARKIFERNAKAIYDAMLKSLMRGDPRVFTALADRGYGKATQQLTFSGSDAEPLDYSVTIQFVDGADGREKMDNSGRQVNLIEGDPEAEADREHDLSVSFVDSEPG